MDWTVFWDFLYRSKCPCCRSHKHGASILQLAKYQYFGVTAFVPELRPLSG
jgi:hypothetical protein